MTDQELELLVESLDKRSKKVELTSKRLNVLNTQQYRRLGKELAKFVNATEINASKNDIWMLTNTEEYTALARALIAPPNLKKLILSGNDIGDMTENDLVGFFDSKIKCHSLILLDLSDNKLEILTPKELEILFGAVVLQYPNLRRLILNNNELGLFEAERWQILSNQLTKLRDLELILYDNPKISDEGLRILLKNSYIRVLSMDKEVLERAQKIHGAPTIVEPIPIKKAPSIELPAEPGKQNLSTLTFREVSQRNVIEEEEPQDTRWCKRFRPCPLYKL